MYLSRVRVTTEGLDRGALLSLMAGDVYANHQLLWQLFSDQPERRFLFRQENEQEQISPGANPRGLPLFYVLSDQQPNNVRGLLQTDTKALVPKLQVGDRLAYRLRANPTVARKQEGSTRSTRHDVLMDAKKLCEKSGPIGPAEQQARMDEAALTWLDRRSENSGFELATVPQISGYRQHAIRRKGQDIRFSSIDYEGVLTVLQPETFTQMLHQGIGRSKAFGCGLMLIRRA